MENIQLHTTCCMSMLHIVYHEAHIPYSELNPVDLHKNSLPSVWNPATSEANKNFSNVILKDSPE